MADQNVAAEAHQRILQAVGDRYNKATPAERTAMERNLAITKARAMSSVRGLKSLTDNVRVNKGLWEVAETITNR